MSLVYKCDCCGRIMNEFASFIAIDCFDNQSKDFIKKYHLCEGCFFELKTNFMTRCTKNDQN